MKASAIFFGLFFLGVLFHPSDEASLTVLLTWFIGIMYMFGWGYFLKRHEEKKEQKENDPYREYPYKNKIQF